MELEVNNMYDEYMYVINYIGNTTDVDWIDEGFIYYDIGRAYVNKLNSDTDPLGIKYTLKAIKILDHKVDPRTGEFI